MKFGYAPSLIGLRPYFEEPDFDRIIELTLMSETLGFDSVWTFDHLNMEGDFGFGDFTDNNLEAWTALSALAAVTKKIRLGNLVLCNPFRYPSVLAKMGATLDVISGGRLELGIGVGWHEPEFIQFGIPFRTFKERFEMLEEGIEVIKRLWTQDKASFSGKHYNLKDAVMEPKPIQKPYPPIWIGGVGKQHTLKLVARVADYWNCSQGYEDAVLKDCLKTLEGHCKAIGRDYSTIVKTKFIYVLISEDEDEVEREIEAVRGERSAEEFRDLHIVGAPEDCVEKIESYRELGIDYMIFTFMDTPSSKGLELFGKTVMPEVK